MSLRRPFLVWVVTLVVIADQAVKALVRPRLELYESLSVIPGFFSLTRVHNTGAAFGLLNGVDFAFKAAILALLPRSRRHVLRAQREERVCT